MIEHYVNNIELNICGMVQSDHVGNCMQSVSYITMINCDK